MTDTPKNLAQLRQDRGMSIEALAASIKVSPAMLQALEAGRFDELPNAAFVRALAMSVCRVLKADPRFILAGLPAPDHHSILTEVPDQQPFRAGRARLNLDSSPLREIKRLLHPKYLVPLLILAAAVGVYHWPASLPEAPEPVEMAQATVVETPASVPVAEAATGSYSFDEAALAAAAAASGALPQTASSPEAAMPASTPMVVAASAPSLVAEAVVTPAKAEAPIAAPGGQGQLVLLASAESWIQVKDAAGEQLLKRLVLAGERIALTGSLPLKIKLGNASAVQLTYQGKPVDLAEHTRANVARFELN